MKAAIAVAFSLLCHSIPSQAAEEPRNLGKPDGSPEYQPSVEPGDGRHLALTLRKLTDGLYPERPFLIWALGSSYTNMLGNGEAWNEAIPARFPNAPAIEYKKMVGNSCPWQYLPGWFRHLALPDQPDLILIYTIGNPDDLDKLLAEIRRSCTADIIVPSIHWRERDQALFEKSVDAADQDVSAVREICAKYGVEFVENRKQWGEYLQKNNLPIPALLKDAVHQSDYGREIINRNILAHLRPAEEPAYDPDDREKRVPVKWDDEGRIRLTFSGNRVDLVGNKSANGGSVPVRIDGRPAGEVPAFLMSYVEPAKTNYKAPAIVPRDNSPHGVLLGESEKIVPQRWTITMTSDEGDFEIEGSVTGADGSGKATLPFSSDSGQIVIEPELWRRPERNRKGDAFTFEVYRSTLAEVDFAGAPGEPFRVTLAQNLENREHELELEKPADGPAEVEFLEIFTPPLR